MIAVMQAEQRRWRRLMGSAWVLFSGLLALITAADLVLSIANAYDPDELRNTGALVVIASIGAAVGLAALAVAVRWRRGKHGRVGLLSLVLTWATLLLILVYQVAGIGSGRL